MTIKELASKLGYYIEGDDIGSGNDLLNALVEAAEKEYARGVAEGAEQERVWLKRYADGMGGAMQELVGRLLEAPGDLT